MVTVSNLVNEYDGLKDDTKPTEGVRNGSVFVEMDTAKVFLFNEAAATWIEVTEEDANADGNDDA